MSIIRAIRDRRSTRKYTPQNVSLATISELLDAARWAPSAHNAQPWRFIILVETLKKHNLAGAMANAWRADLIKSGSYSKMQEVPIKASIERFTNAPVIIVACITLVDMCIHTDESAQKSERDLAVQSLGAAMQNILLAAENKKLGTCWYCAPIFCKDTIRESLAIPKEVEPQALITVGYPDEKPKAPARKPPHAFSHLNRWGEKLQ